MPLNDTSGNGQAETGALFTTGSEPAGFAEGNKELVEDLHRQAVTTVLNLHDKVFVRTRKAQRYRAVRVTEFDGIAENIV